MRNMEIYTQKPSHTGIFVEKCVFTAVIQWYSSLFRCLFLFSANYFVRFAFTAFLLYQSLFHTLLHFKLYGCCALTSYAICVNFTFFAERKQITRRMELTAANWNVSSHKYKPCDIWLFTRTCVCVSERRKFQRVLFFIQLFYRCVLCSILSSTVLNGLSFDWFISIISVYRLT